MVKIEYAENVRLTKRDLQIIIDTFHKYFLPEDHLWLFGSRAKMKRRGGDIDLYIETHESDSNNASKKKWDFSWELQEKLGEQKIDVVLNMIFSNYSLPIYKIAVEKGVKLV